MCKLECLVKPGKSENKSTGFGVRRSGFSLGLFLRLAMGQVGLPLKNFRAFRHLSVVEATTCFYIRVTDLHPGVTLMSEAVTQAALQQDIRGSKPVGRPVVQAGDRRT